MATTKQQRAARRNIKKAAAAPAASGRSASCRSARAPRSASRRTRSSAAGGEANHGDAGSRAARGVDARAAGVAPGRGAGRISRRRCPAIAGRPRSAASCGGWGVGAGALAGVAGLAASQEIKAEDARSEDMMWLHGAANFTILLGATGVALVAQLPAAQRRQRGGRSRRLRRWRCTPPTSAARWCTRTASASAPCRGSRRPACAAARRCCRPSAPGTFLRDVVKGFAWLVRRTVRALSGRQPVSRGALGIESIDRPGAPAIGQRSDETDA